MQKNRSRRIKTAVVAMVALAAFSAQAFSQTTYPKPITGTTITITSGGLQRTFIVHIPPTPKSTPGAVLIFHGGSGNPAAASQMQGLTLMDTVADREGFYSVYPQALNGHWTDGRISTAGGANDVQFVKDIAAYLTRTYKVSSTKIFSAGISNGGIMQYQLACTAPGLIRAIAPVAADMTLAMQSTCHPTKFTPVIMFSGTADQYMPYGGGFPVVNTGQTAVVATVPKNTTFSSTVTSDEFASAAATAASFAAMSVCKSSTSTDLPDKAVDGTTVTKTVYNSCASGGGTYLYTIINGGHTWPGGTNVGTTGMGLSTSDISANEEMVAFFKLFGL